MVCVELMISKKFWGRGVWSWTGGGLGNQCLVVHSNSSTGFLTLCKVKTAHGDGQQLLSQIKMIHGNRHT